MKISPVRTLYLAKIRDITKKYVQLDIDGLPEAEKIRRRLYNWQQRKRIGETSTIQLSPNPTEIYSVYNSITLSHENNFHQ